MLSPCASSSSSPPPPAPSRSTTADAGDAAAGEPSSTSSTSSASSSAGAGATAGDGVAASCICRRFFAACCFADASHSRRSSGCSCSSFRGALRSRSGRLSPRPRAACAAARARRAATSPRVKSVFSPATTRRCAAACASSACGSSFDHGGGSCTVFALRDRSERRHGRSTG